MEKPQALIATWLRKLGPSETVSERTFGHCVAIALEKAPRLPDKNGDRRDKAWYPSQVAEGNPSTSLEEKTSELGRASAGPVLDDRSSSHPARCRDPAAGERFIETTRLTGKKKNVTTDGDEQEDTVRLWTIPTVMLLAFPPVPDKMIDR